MDLGIAGRKAIVCASSRGLGRACATRARRGRLRGRDQRPRQGTLEATAAEIRKATGAKITRSRPMSPRRKARRRCSPPARSPTSWSTTMPARRSAISASSTAQKMIDGVIGNMIVPIELIAEGDRPDGGEKKFGRIVNITSGSVKMPLVGLDLSSGARAGLTALPRRRRALGRRSHNVTINFMLPGHVRHRPAALQLRRSTAKKRGISSSRRWRSASRSVPAKRLGQPDEFGATCAFLCSAHAGYITGQNILIDGGVSGAFRIDGARFLKAQPGMTVTSARPCPSPHRRMMPTAIHPKENRHEARPLRRGRQGKARHHRQERQDPRPVEGGERHRRRGAVARRASPRSRRPTSTSCRW